jgi:5,10-methylene-tetrahydrofolate dehydrogenase/methenyl tetrahydrofolate cyclohydrolase
MEQKPGLAVILVGSRTDSATYVRMKRKACLEVGIQNFSVDYEETITEEELLQKVDELNVNPEVHGILIQLPLPKHINETTILERVSVEKDVDGLHPLNMARLSRTQTHSVRGGRFSFDALDFNVACTPQGCIELLDRIGCPIESKRAVVLGRSNIVGIPVALLLMQRNATVTIVHSKSADVPSLVREADIVIAAVGRPELVQGDWIKPGAVVIDVGVNSVPDATKKKGYRLVGDCHYESCVETASRITPVPGGVGPMTIAMLLRNTMNSAMRSQQKMSSLPNPPAAEATDAPTNL